MSRTNGEMGSLLGYLVLYRIDICCSGPQRNVRIYCEFMHEIALDSNIDTSEFVSCMDSILKSKIYYRVYVANGRLSLVKWTRIKLEQRPLFLSQFVLCLASIKTKMI